MNFIKFRQKNSRWVIAFLVACSSLSLITHAAPLAGWTAYNDSAFHPGQVNGDNATTFGLGRGFEGEGQSGLLRDFDAGTNTDVGVAYTEVFSTGSVSSANDAAQFVDGTDAARIFADKVDLTGNISYGDSPGWHVDLTITNLNPSRRYTFYGTVNRNGGAGYADRVTNWKLMGADSSVYASSAGAHKVSENSVEFSTGENGAGYVAGWKNINPGADGIIVIRTSHTVGEANGGIPGAHAYKGYAGGLFMLALQPDNWEAYNDSAFKAGQANADNVTTFGLGRSFEGEGAAGDLKVVTDGEDTQVNVSYSETFSTGSVSSAGDTATFTPGTDAAEVFDGKVDASGNISYGDSPGWHVDLTISGLDPTRFYTFVGTVNRNGGAGYADRVTNWKIMGADSFTYASSSGAKKVADDSVEFSTGDNTAGYVARWTDVKPGADGTIVIRTSHTVGEANGGIPGAHAYKGYAGGMFMVKVQPDSPFRWQAFNDSAFKAGQVNADNVTTFGLGRGFEGEGSSGELLKIDTGDDTGVAASYTETVSTGSVSSAGDVAQYPAGSDAEAVFSGIVDYSGNISYGDSPGWYVDLTFTGLDSAKHYSFVGTVNRAGGAGYADRVTNWKIIGADSATYASSAGAHKVSDSSVEFITGDNTAGYVARWNDISPGADGTFVIRTSHTVGEANGGLPGAHAYKGYAGGVFMLAEQIGSTNSAGKPLEIFSIAPSDAAVDVSPNTPVQVVIKNGDRALKTGSIHLLVDSTEVTPLITTNADSTTITYTAIAMFASSSAHTVHLAFTDNAVAPQAYSKDWTFTVLDYSSFPVIPAADAITFDASKYQERGFALKIVAPNPDDGYTISSIDEAIAILDQNPPSLSDPAITNSLGFYIETNTINYQIDGNPIGNKAGDRKFPGILSSSDPGNMFAIDLNTLLYLKPGYYHFNITMQQGFSLREGTGNAETELPVTFTPCSNCGGDDGPWFTDFLVQKEGLYPFHLIYYNEGGSASLEWLNISPLNIRYLINDVSADAIPAYVPLNAIATVPKIQIARNGNQIVITWQNGSTLQQADTINGQWSDVTGATSPYAVVAPVAATKFYRIKQ
jgi:hypothetical protein